MDSVEVPTDYMEASADSVKYLTAPMGTCTASMDAYTRLPLRLWTIPLAPNETALIGFCSSQPVDI